MSRQKILIDTDIGDDIDDAQALVLAMRSPEVEIVGVTTVFKNVTARAKIAKRILELGGFGSTPVACGSAQPLLFAVDANEVPCQYTNELDDLSLGIDSHAIDFIIETILARPGEITVLAIGALTNIALALQTEPRIQTAIKELVWMGGAFYYQFRTWNAMCDPEAARIVFDSDLPIRVVSRDVCIHCRLDTLNAERLRNCDDRATQHLAELHDLWRQGADRDAVLFDPLALTATFNDEFLGFKPERVGVETSGEFTRGLTFLYDDLYERRDMLALPSDVSLRGQRSVSIAYRVDAARFVEFFVNRVSSPPPDTAARP